LRGGGSRKSAETEQAPRVKLSDADIPDVLMPGIWPSLIKAYRTGNSVDVYTGSYPKAENKDDAQSFALKS